jgi:hypothetical protein
MKTGKQFKLNLNKDFNTYYGSVDYKNPKSIYINISSWFSPLVECDNWDRAVNGLKRNIHRHINSTDMEDLFLRKKQIIDLDIRTSGIRPNKRSYMNCEITLFLNKEEPIKSDNIKTAVQNLLNNVITDSLIVSPHFNFYKTKK